MEDVAGMIRLHGMIREGEKVLVAVSGGADSVCLLHVLHDLGYAVEVGHFDHQTRGGESAVDAVFVRELAEGLGLPCHTASRPIADEAAETALSFEEYARQARYTFLVETAAKAGCAALATAHHADDQAETVLMRVLRGTSPRGLAGIPPVRDEGGIRIIRPLVGCSRAEILSYMDAHELAYRTDRTNADTRVPRNKVRRELLPRLAREHNPQVREALCRLAESQRVENAFVQAAADAFLGDCLEGEGKVNRQKFREGDAALQHRAILELGWRHGVDCPMTRVSGAATFICEGGAGQAFDLGGGVLLRNGRASTAIEAGRPPLDDRAVPLAVPGESAAHGKAFRVRMLDARPAADLAAYCSPSRQVFDAAALGADVVVRRRRPGDRFTPLGMSGTKKLKDYFVDAGVAVWERDLSLLLVAGGRIAWIVGGAVSAHVAGGPETSRWIEVEVVDAVE